MLYIGTISLLLAGMAISQTEAPPPAVCLDYPIGIQFLSGKSGSKGTLIDAAALESALSVMNRNLELMLLADEDRFQIIGHTDSRECEGRECIALSQSRAESVYRWLIEHGLRDELIVEVIGVGDSIPVDLNDTEEQRANNRRVEINTVYSD